MALARTARRGEYALVYVSAGSYFRTDRLGAMAMRALIDGKSDAQAIDLIEGMEAGTGERARRLIDVLDAIDAMDRTRPTDRRRWHARHLAEVGMGVTLSLLAPICRFAPAAALARLFAISSSSAIANLVWRSTSVTIVENLRSSVDADWQDSQVLEVARRCVAAPAGNYMFAYMSTTLPAERLGGLLERLIDRESADQLARRVRVEGPTIGVFLHGPLTLALPNLLRRRGHDVVRAVIPWTHGIYLSEKAGPLQDFFGESLQTAVVLGDPLRLADLLRHLKAGRSVFTALDEPARAWKPTADIEMLGQWFPRNDGPAWLSVRSGCPVALWTTHVSRFGVVISASELMRADPSLPIEKRVADLSERLYGHADAAIRGHPVAWGRGWVIWRRGSGRRADQTPRPQKVAGLSAT